MPLEPGVGVGGTPLCGLRMCGSKGSGEGYGFFGSRFGLKQGIDFDHFVLK